MADTPKVRFEGFTDDWERRKLSDVVNVYDGVHQTPEYQDSGIMFLSVENIATLESKKYISEEAFERDYKVYPEKGDILMTRIGDVGTTNVVESVEKMAFYVSLALMKPIEIDSYFLCNSMKTNAFQIGLRERTLVTAIPQKINKDEIGKVSVWITDDHDEQKRIGEYFKNLDHIITLHQRKCDETKELKKYMLQKMFPQNGKKIPEIRFAGFTDAWEQRRLGDYSELITKGTTPSGFCEGGNVTFVKIEALREKRVIKELCSAISEEIHKGELSRSILKENDIVFAIAGATVGKCAVITRNILPANTNQALAIIRLKSSINFDFVYFSLTSKQMELYINQSKSVGAQPNLSLAQMNAFEFLCPCKKEEQQKIAEYFSTLDYLITLHQHKCDELKEVKKFMLQNMFPQKG